MGLNFQGRPESGLQYFESRGLLFRTRHSTPGRLRLPRSPGMHPHRKRHLGACAKKGKAEGDLHAQKIQ